LRPNRFPAKTPRVPRCRLTGDFSTTNLGRLQDLLRRPSAGIRRPSPWTRTWLQDAGGYPDRRSVRKPSPHFWRLTQMNPECPSLLPHASNGSAIHAATCSREPLSPWPLFPRLSPSPLSPASTPLSASTPASSSR